MEPSEELSSSFGKANQSKQPLGNSRDTVAGMLRSVSPSVTSFKPSWPNKQMDGWDGLFYTDTSLSARAHRHMMTRVQNNQNKQLEWQIRPPPWLRETLKHGCWYPRSYPPSHRIKSLSPKIAAYPNLRISPKHKLTPSNNPYEHPHEYLSSSNMTIGKAPIQMGIQIEYHPQMKIVYCYEVRPLR